MGKDWTVLQSDLLLLNKLLLTLHLQTFCHSLRYYLTLEGDWLCFVNNTLVDGLGLRCHDTVSYTHLTLPTNREV